MIDLDRLLELRLVVARHGEMDRAAWWNTRGMLGRHGAIALQRGLPRTHRFARARVVFTVARWRCEELFDPPGCVTLWKLPIDVEEAFEAHWRRWLSSPDRWDPLFDRLEASQEGALLTELADSDLISTPEIEAVRELRRSAEGRAVQLSGEHRVSDFLTNWLYHQYVEGAYRLKPADVGEHRPHLLRRSPHGGLQGFGVELSQPPAQKVLSQVSSHCHWAIPKRACERLICSAWSAAACSAASCAAASTRRRSPPEFV